MKDMIGFCGLDCEKCDAYIATIHNDQALREKRRHYLRRLPGIGKLFDCGSDYSQ